MPVAIHQVLATLGYGDAIGHEVLGIQRVLRAAGYESEIFVQTADPRLEDQTLDYLDLPDASHPDNILIHHFSIGSRASRLAYALPDRMVLVYHNITPPEFFVGVNKMLAKLCYLGRRELRFYRERCDLALGDSEYNRQELDAIGFPATGVLPVIPDFAHLAGPANYLQAGQLDDDWVNVLFVGRIIPNKRIEDVIRCFHAYKQWFNPRSRLLLVGSHVGLREIRVDGAALRRRHRRPGCALPRSRRQRRTVRVLRDRRRVPLLQRARRVLRAAGRVVPYGRAGAGVCRHGGARHDGRRRRALHQQAPPARGRLDRRRRR